MGRGRAVTDVERGEIKGLLSAGLSQRAVAQAIGRSEKLVRSCVIRGLDNPPGTSTGRKRVLNDYTVRQIRRHASNTQVTSSRLIDELNLTASVSTVNRCINDSGHLKYARMQCRPSMTKGICSERREYAVTYHTWTEEWNRIIFSDEKKFNLDGPDGFAYYWHDLRKEKMIFSTRQAGGGSVMVWGGFSSEYKCELFTTTQTINAARYTEVLSAHMLPIFRQLQLDHDEECQFMHDHAPPHTANHTTHWLESKGVPLHPSPRKSPDLNPMENMFGNLARRVYANGKHYSTVRDLTESIIVCWNDIEQAECRALTSSMPNRLVKVIEKKGAATEY